MARKLRKLTVARLRAWLEEQPAGATFKTKDPRQCPIAAFIDEDHAVYTRHIALHVRPDEDMSGADLPKGDYHRIELPWWAQRFVETVDLIDQTVSRDAALRILNEAAKRPTKRAAP